jgi:hypothetical protein
VGKRYKGQKAKGRGYKGGKMEYWNIGMLDLYLLTKSCRKGKKKAEKQKAGKQGVKGMWYRGHRAQGMEQRV